MHLKDLVAHFQRMFIVYYTIIYCFGLFIVLCGLHFDRKSRIHCEKYDEKYYDQ